jgi:hypothetical protein
MDVCRVGRGLAAALDVHPHLEQARLAARDLHFRAVPQLHVQTSADPELNAGDEVQVEDLSTIGAEEAPRIDASVEACQGATE